MNKELTAAEGFHPEKIQARIRRQILIPGAFSLILSIVVFGLSFLLFPLAANLPETTGTGANTRQIPWDMLGNITGLITMSLFFGGVVFAFLEYVQTAIQRKRESAEASFNIYKELYDRLMNTEALEARRWIILNLPTLEDAGNDRTLWQERAKKVLDEIPAGWQSERAPGREYLKQVLNTFDFIGFVAQHYWNMENELVMWMSPSVAKVWERIEPIVEEEADKRHEPDYYESARNFGKYCVEWRQKNFPKSRVIKNAT
jgi:hypothetical protein